MSFTDYECVTCRGLLTGGRCTNELCPGFVSREETTEPVTAPDWAALVAAVKHADGCTYVRGQLYHDEAGACDCDRDARIARGVAAVRESDRLHVCKYLGDGVFECECGFRLTAENSPFFAHVDAAAARAFEETSR